MPKLEVEGRGTFDVPEGTAAGPGDRGERRGGYPAPLRFLR